MAADLVINKPLGLSPSYIEFKRAHLYTINPVGFGSMLIASALSLAAYFHAFGETLYAFSPFLALGTAVVLPPVIAVVTRGRYYIARPDRLLDGEEDRSQEASTVTCTVCQKEFELPDRPSAPFTVN